MNPRAATNDLLPFQGSPFSQLGYFSKLPKSFFLYQRCILYSGEGGIRTHAPFRTNGFQDRRVMTTSLPLHTSPRRSASFSADRIISLIFPSVKQFFKLFLFFCFLCNSRFSRISESIVIFAASHSYRSQSACHSFSFVCCSNIALAKTRSSGVVILILL